MSAVYQYKQSQKVEIFYENYNDGMPATFEGIIIRTWFDTYNRDYFDNHGTIAIYFVVFVESIGLEKLDTFRVEWVREKNITKIICNNIDKNWDFLKNCDVTKNRL